MTMEEATLAIEAHLSQYLENPEIAVDVLGYNSKVFYVVTQGAGLGDGVIILPSRGNETVLDAIGKIQGLQSNSSTRMWIARPGSNDCGGDQILPVDWLAVTQRGDTTTNFQILPGDRLYVSEDKLVAFDTKLGKLFSPFERMFGVTLLGTQTARQINFYNQGGNFGGGFGGFGGGQGGGVTGGAGAAGAGGYLGLLQSAQQIRNQRANVAALADSVEQLQASNDAGRIDRFQVDLARQALYNAQSQLLTAEAGYQSSLDGFKITLGLPPELDIKIEDPLLDHFNLLDPDLEQLQARVTSALARLREYRGTMGEAAPDADAAPALPAPPLDLAAIIAECEKLQKLVTERIAVVESDFEKVDAAAPHRREQLRQLAARPEAQSAELDPQLLDPAGLDKRIAQRRRDLDSLKQQIDRLWVQLERFDDDNAMDERELASALIETISSLSGRLLELSLLQAGARLEAITFQPIELNPEQALLIAAVNRRDWQNARASLVDTWRLIYFNANDLLSDLDIVFSGDIGNVGDNPLRIRDTRGRLRVGVEFDAPLTRLSERNVYRQSLIEFQQARRSYYQFRDRIQQGLRSTLRQVRLNEINFELRRAAVLVAISQVDLTQLRLSEPPQVGAEQQFGNTTARDLVQSLADLLNVQNDFLSVWVNHEVQRMGLDFDLGVMQLDPQGLRLEPPCTYAEYYELAMASCIDKRYPS
ncbi:MAG: TolC family protein, partial [Planctomycetales bacterium]|nr:TolC family protein [Planctomycetales bacterium]